jgi:hypothetical protein
MTRLQRMRESKSEYEKALLAIDLLPGTKFDKEIRRLVQTINAIDGCFKNSTLPEKIERARYRMLKAQACDIGCEFMRAVRGGASQWFHDFADAINDFKRHMRKRNPEKDKLRAEIQRIYRHLYARHPGRKPSLSLRAIKTLLKQRSITANERGYGEELFGRRIRTICEGMNYKIDGVTGRPRKADGIGHKKSNPVTIIRKK